MTQRHTQKNLVLHYAKASIEQEVKASIEQSASNVTEGLGEDQSGLGNHATVYGNVVSKQLKGRPAIVFGGGVHGSSYLQLPKGFWLM